MKQLDSTGADREVTPSQQIEAKLKEVEEEFLCSLDKCDDSDPRKKMAALVTALRRAITDLDTCCEPKALSDIANILTNKREQG